MKRTMAKVIAVVGMGLLTFPSAGSSLDSSSSGSPDGRSIDDLQTAAETGDIIAQCNLGFAYAAGKVVPASYEVSKLYFVMAGDWQVQVILHWPDGHAETQSFPVTIDGDHHH